MADCDVTFGCERDSAVDGAQQCHVDDRQCVGQHVQLHRERVVLNEHRHGEEEDGTNDVYLKGILSCQSSLI